MVKFEPEIKDIMINAVQSSIEFENGPKQDPLKLVATYNADEWEEFTDEWVHSLEGEYDDSERLAGAGDKGIDVAGYCDNNRLAGRWDNFQCKCYQARPLNFGNIAPEFGKILWYSFSKIYTPPRACYFISPKGPSTSLALLVSHAPNLKAKVIKEWDQMISTEITTLKIELSGDFLKYVEAFDFRIFKVPSPRWTVDQHRKTRYYNGRFGGGLPPRPKPESPPGEIAENEKTYVDRLLEAYAEHKGIESLGVGDLPKWKNLNGHLNRSREAFFDAEGLRVFVRDLTEPGTFAALQDQIYDGVVDTKDKPHSDGYECVVAVTEQAQSLSLDAHPLNKVALPTTRRGVCHQLANDGKLVWKQ